MNSKIKVINNRTLYIPIIISIIIFILLGQFILFGIHSYFYNHMSELSINLASGYSYSIEKSLNAENLFELLIEDKLLLASETTGIYARIENRSSLLQYAQTLRVDEINIYNSQGILVLSTMPEGTQWQVFEGHPIYDFIASPDSSMIEDIRPNHVTGIEYKYGYYKLDNGSIIQIGLLASKINEIIGNMNANSALNDVLTNNSSIVFVCFSDSGLVKRSCLGNDLEDNSYEDIIENNLMNQSEVIGKISPNDLSMYVLYVPIEI